MLEVTAEVLGQVRRAKTTAKRSMRWAVTTLTVADSAERISALLTAEDDLRDAGGVVDLVTRVTGGSSGAGGAVVDVELAAEE